MVEKTAEKVKFDKEEDIKPLLIAFRKIFEPMVKSMQSIAKIPEEIERITKNIAKDLESGVPKRVANGAEKIAEKPELVGPPAPDDDEDPMKKHLEKQTELLQVLLDQGVPAKLDENNKLVKLTEKEIKESRKEFITEKKEQTKIEKQIESASKEEGLDAEQQAIKIQELQQQLEKSRETTSKLETTLGSRTPQKIQQQERPGFQAPAFAKEAYSMGKESLMAGPNAIMQLKDSFMDNIGNPLKSLIGLNKKHQKTMEDYAEEEEERAEEGGIISKLIAAGVIALLVKFKIFTDNLKNIPKSIETAKQKAYNQARDEGKGMIEAEYIGEQAAGDKLIEVNEEQSYHSDYASRFGPSNEFSIAQDMLRNRIEDKDNKNYLRKTADQQNQAISDLGFLSQYDFTQKERPPVIINSPTYNSDNSVKTGGEGGSGPKPDTDKLSGSGAEIILR